MHALTEKGKEKGKERGRERTVWRSPLRWCRDHYRHFIRRWHPCAGWRPFVRGELAFPPSSFVVTNLTSFLLGVGSLFLWVAWL